MDNHFLSTFIIILVDSITTTLQRKLLLKLHSLIHSLYYDWERSLPVLINMQRAVNTTTT